ncbi:apurinic endonuclease-redox isoform X3 [Micractinium conductrix]|uniref:DNA-(apurinic or apyrimidinic site) endonuclease n=1 Tax=Micractinium conductrix TaxID=554055 RepID=A0A2P6V1Q3_9CHLO|nr:apurinic endonuclease-redox isoform X3 [Micractinium conductrix]|eukprot:PSC68027.1 apurinic endonuclease-redox isoform X3 [Micractinium conductrix]
MLASISGVYRASVTSRAALVRPFAAAAAAAAMPPRKRKADAQADAPAAAEPAAAAADGEPAGSPATATAAKPKAKRAPAKPKAPAGPLWDSSLRPAPLAEDVPACRILSWNVAGLRALLKKVKEVADGKRAGENIPSPLALAQAEGADVVCLQEIKLQEDHCADALAGLELPPGWHCSWNCSRDKKGYSGTAILSRQEPLSITYGIGAAEHDGEGRVTTAEFPSFFLVNCYVPNSGEGLKRLDYRVGSWDKVFAAYLKGLEARGKPVVLTGDLNVAPTELDIHNPKGNLTSAGFTPEERQSFQEQLLGSAGLVDTFRAQYPRGTWPTRTGDTASTRAPTTRGGGWIIFWCLPRWRHACMTATTCHRCWAPTTAPWACAMGFEFSDDAALLVSGVAGGLYAVHAMAAPRNFHDLHMTKPQPISGSTDPSWRWMGFCLGCNSGTNFLISASDSPKVKKDYLKYAGATWLGAAALTAYHVQEGIQKRDVGLAGVAAQAAVGALCLWRGYREDEAAMGFEITDEMVLRLSGAADAVYAFHSLAAPRNLHETHMDKAHPGTAGTDASWRWMGLNLGAQSAADLTIAASDSPKEGIQKRDMGLTGAAVQAGMAALCLWRGFKKEEEGK